MPVAAGLGVRIVPRGVEKEPIEGLVIRPLEELPKAVALVAAWRADSINPFVDLFEQCLKEQRLPIGDQSSAP